MNADTSKTIKAVALYAAQVCYASMPRPQSARNSGSYNFNAGRKNVTAIYWYRQYLSIDLVKVFKHP